MSEPSPPEAEQAGLEAEPLFHSDGPGRFTPTAHTRGPWDPGAQHGGAPAALLGRMFAAHDNPGGEVVINRISMELIRAVPLEALKIEVRTLRAGRRVELLEAALSAGGRVCIHARALRQRRGELPGLPEPDRGTAIRPPQESEPMGDIESPFKPGGDGAEDEMGRTGVEGRLAAGRLGEGAATVWFRLRRAVLDDLPPLAIERVLVAADFQNGISAVVPFDRYVFVNTDLTVHLHRHPVGEWVAVEATTSVAADGLGVSEARILDQHGPIGRGAQSLIVSLR